MTTSPFDEANSWSHPLITQYNQPGIGRRRLLLMAGAGLAASVPLAPFRLVAAQEGTPAAEPATRITGEDDARDRLERAAGAMSSLQTFAFEIETVAGETNLMSGITLGLIEGMVRRPSDFMASVEVTTPFGSIKLTAIGIDNTAWIQDPLGSGDWMALEGIGDIAAILNPDTLILASVSIIQDAVIDGSDRIDGDETIRIAGTINLSETAALLDEAAAEISSDPLDVLVWIDDSDHIREIEIAGPIIATESATVVRSIRFHDFDEPVEIDEPNL